MSDKKMNILIPGDFTKEHYPQEQLAYIKLLAGACKADVNLMHLGSPKSIPHTYNPLLFNNIYQEMEQKARHNMNHISKAVVSTNTTSEYKLIGHEKNKNEIEGHLQTMNPQFIILNKSTLSVSQKFSKYNIPFLFLPTEAQSSLPSKIALFLSTNVDITSDGIDFFLQMTRNITGELQVFYTGQKIQATKDNLQKELNHINLSHGINMNLIDSDTAHAPEKIFQTIKTNEISLSLIIQQKKQSAVNGAFNSSPIKKLASKVKHPFFFCTT